MQASSHGPSAETLYDSGAGLVLADKEMWPDDLDKKTLADVSQALAKWRKASSSVKRQSSSQTPVHPWGNKKRRSVRDVALALKEWLVFVEADKAVVTDCEEAVALRGFVSWRQLDGLSEDDLNGWSGKPWVQALLARVIRAASENVRIPKVSSMSSSSTTPFP